MRTSTKVAYNTIIQITSKIISTILGLFAVRVMADYLGTAGFGEYTTIITFISFFAIIADLGLALVTVQLISQKNVDEGKILSNLFGLRLVSALIFLGIAPFIVFIFPYGTAIKVGVFIAAFSFFFAALNQIFIGLFQKKLRMDKVSIAEISGRAVLVAGIIFAARMNYGLNGLLWATVAAAAVNFILLFFFSLGRARIRFGFDRVIWKEIIAKSWPLAITIIFNLLYLKTDTIILSLVRPLNEVGIYGAAYKVIDVLVTLPFLFSGIVLPILASAWLSGDKEKWGRTLNKSFNLLAILAFPLIAGTWLVSGRVMTLVAGEDFVSSGSVLNILIVAAGVIFLGNIFSHAVIAIDRQKIMIPAYFFTALTSLVGYFIFIPRFSYFGAAWVTVYSETFIALASFYVVYRYAKFSPDWKIVIKSLLASALMFAAGALLKGTTLFIVIPALFVIYFLSLYLLKGITRKDLAILSPKNIYPSDIPGRGQPD